MLAIRNLVDTPMWECAPRLTHTLKSPGRQVHSDHLGSRLFLLQSEVVLDCKLLRRSRDLSVAIFTNVLDGWRARDSCVKLPNNSLSYSS